MTTKPKEIHHAQKSHTVVKAAPVPVPAKPQVDLTGVKVSIGRGIVPDLTKLTRDEKAQLLVDLDAESKAETVFKYPEREKMRDAVRTALR
jgi:hypothetical protein